MKSVSLSRSSGDGSREPLKGDVVRSCHQRAASEPSPIGDRSGELGVGLVFFEDAEGLGLRSSYAKCIERRHGFSY